MLPPIMYRSLSFWGKLGSSLTANARLVSGPSATKETCGEVILMKRHQRAASRSGQGGGSHLVLVLRHQPDHCADRMFFLDFLLPLWVFFFYHIPKSIGSKVVSRRVSGSNQSRTRTSEHWNLPKNLQLSAVFSGICGQRCR